MEAPILLVQVAFLLLITKTGSFTINKLSNLETLDTQTLPDHVTVPSLSSADETSSQSSLTATTMPEFHYPVSCSDDEESCECPGNKSSCMFVLIVEELQTFTSYR